MTDITRIAQALSALGLEIEAQNLVQREQFQPYHSFGPGESETTHSITNFISLTGDAEVVELTVEREALIAGRTLRDADTEGLLGEDTLIVAIERDGSIITPKGETTIQPDDVVTIFSQQAMANETLQLFSNEMSDLSE
jgi:Trk K+ transport system NAD-binding subunit